MSIHFNLKRKKIVYKISFILSISQWYAKSKYFSHLNRRFWQIHSCIWLYREIKLENLSICIDIYMLNNRLFYLKNVANREVECWRFMEF